MEIEIIWCDDDIILINKPAGLLTIRDGYDPTLPYAAGILQSNYGKLFVVHRLDRHTSGILLLARNAQSHRNLNEQFQNRQTQKTYHAIIQGVPSWDEFHAEFPLQIDGDRRHRTKVDYEKGKLALTDFSVMERFSSHSLIKAIPHTGYTHQIRAHLLATGFPILGDQLYSIPNPTTSPKPHRFPKEPQLINRMALHAFSLSFIHPTTETTFYLEASHPYDFQDALNFLRTPQ
jgi:tRNA pseudouridine32 synthase / 23S rRNA pseudouridine746 synthase